jgi:glutamyl-tRNA synthetase
MTAIANFAFAKAYGGELVLRIDDTDVERSEAEHEAALIATLEEMGLTWDEGPLRQSERTARYEELVGGLLESGAAYRCFCSTERLEELHATQRALKKPPRYDGRCRDLDLDEARSRAASEPHVVRLKVDPGVAFDVDDLVHGLVKGPPGSFDDFILRRSDGGYGYQFASVCDDADYRITHVLRGEDHLPNTPRQLAIFAALEVEAPQFGHLPLLMASHGKKLSKRDPQGTVEELLGQQYHPQVIARYLWELLGQDDHVFAIDAVPASAPHVSLERIDSVAREWMGERPAEELAAMAQPLLNGSIAGPEWAPLLLDIAPSAATPALLAAQLQPLLQNEPVDVDPWPIDALAAELEGNSWKSPELLAESLAIVRAAAKADGRSVKDTLKPIRLALTGVEHGPKLELVIYALGRDRVLERLGNSRTREMEGSEQQ